MGCATSAINMDGRSTLSPSRIGDFFQDLGHGFKQCGRGQHQPNRNREARNLLKRAQHPLIKEYTVSHVMLRIPI